MQDLLPGRTVVVALTADAPYGGKWNLACPTLVLDKVAPYRLRRQIARAFAGKFGFQLTDHLTASVKRFLRDWHVQVAMGEYLDLSLPWFRLARELGIRFFGHAHGYDVSERLREAKWCREYLQYNGAAGIITMSEFSREKLVNLGLEGNKIHVVPYGVDVVAEPLMREQTHIVRCVAVGRMVAKKAPILTLDAFRRAAEVCPNLRLDYVGVGELLPAVRHFVRAFDLSEKVMLYGSQPNEVVHKLMEAADIFLQHSMTDTETGDEEGCPVAILEAMSRSLPVVSTRHAGIPEAVVDGTTGYLVDEGSNVAMAERIVALASNYDLRRRTGTAGWQRAKEFFSWKKERSELTKVLGVG